MFAALNTFKEVQEVIKFYTDLAKDLHDIDIDIVVFEEDSSISATPETFRVALCTLKGVEQEKLHFCNLEHYGSLSTLEYYHTQVQNVVYELVVRPLEAIIEVYEISYDNGKKSSKKRNSKNKDDESIIRKKVDMFKLTNVFPSNIFMDTLRMGMEK